MQNAKSTATERLRRIQELCAAVDREIATSAEQRRLLEELAAEAEELARVIRQDLVVFPRDPDT